MRRLAGVFTALVLILVLVPVAGAHHKPWHPVPPGHQSTTTEGTSDTTTTSTTAPSSTTTTTLEGSSTTSTTSTTTAPTTTTTTTTLPAATITLSQDWLITGTDTRSGFIVEANGHAIFCDGCSVDWSDCEVRNARTVTFRNGAGPSHLADCLILDSGGPNLGEYPLHWHLNGDSTRGTVVERVTVRNGRNHAFVPHGSHGITFIDTRAENIAGDAYWWDAPGTNESCSFRKFCTLDNSNDTLIDRAVVDGVSNGPGDTRGFTLSAFVLGAGSGNVIRNSVARNVTPSHLVNCSAYQWPEYANQNVGGNVWVFENNTGTSACHGIFVWQNDGNHHIIDGFTGGGIDHGAYDNRYDYRNVNVPYIEVHAVGWVVSDSEVGEIIIRPHTTRGQVTFTNVTGSRIVVRDAPASSTADEPIDFFINGTNLTCSDVEWVNPHPETRVVIDGQDC